MSTCDWTLPCFLSLRRDEIDAHVGRTFRLIILISQESLQLLLTPEGSFSKQTLTVTLICGHKHNYFEDNLMSLSQPSTAVASPGAYDLSSYGLLIGYTGPDINSLRWRAGVNFNQKVAGELCNRRATIVAVAHLAWMVGSSTHAGSTAE